MMDTIEPDREARPVAVNVVPDADQLLAVVAHSLLNSLSVIYGSAATLGDFGERLSGDQRQEFLVTIMRQSEHVMEVLKDMIRGGSPEVLAALADLDSRDS